MAALAAAMVFGCLPQASEAQSRTEKQLIAQADAFIANKPAALQPFFHTLYMEGEWNAVLNFDLLSLAALEVGRKDIAERALDQATMRILAIYADDPTAAQARSLWSSEEVKDFKGEPYERAMTFFYRGLLYLAAQDLQNARASFLQAELQNTMGQSEKYESTFSLATYLAAWVSSCDGNAARAQELLGKIRKSKINDPFFVGMSDSFPKHLVLTERGIGPEKVTYGDTKSILGFLPQPDVEGRFSVVYKNPAEIKPQHGVAVNLDFLSLTRGDRKIQGILDGKAVFKEKSGGVADFSATLADAAFYQQLTSLGSDKPEVAESMGALGLGASLIGGIAQMLSSAANAEADIRYWGSLPKYIDIEAFESGEAPAIDSIVATATKLKRPVLLQATLPNSCSIAYAREFSALDPTTGGTGNPSPWPAVPHEQKRAKANQQFRNMLMNTF